MSVLHQLWVLLHKCGRFVSESTLLHMGTNSFYINISLPLTHFQDSVFFCTFKLVPEAKFRNNTWNDVCHKTRIVQDYLIFTRFYLVVFLGIKSKQMLPFFFFFSFTLLYKISCRTFLYTDLKKESVKKTLRMFLSLHTLCPSVLRSPSFIFLKN